MKFQNHPKNAYFILPAIFVLLIIYYVLKLFGGPKLIGQYDTSRVSKIENDLFIKLYSQSLYTIE